MFGLSRNFHVVLARGSSLFKETRPVPGPRSTDRSWSVATDRTADDHFESTPSDARCNSSTMSWLYHSQ